MTSRLPITPLDKRADCTRASNDWAHFDLQLEHATCCRSAYQRELLLLACRKINAAPGTCYGADWAKLKAASQYDALASIIACSNYAHREDFIRCGYSSFHCEDRLLCPACAYRRLARPLREEFGNAFAATQVIYYFVLSFSLNPDEASRFIFRDIGPSEIHQLKYRGLARPCSAEGFGIPFDSGDDLFQCRLLWETIMQTIGEFTRSSHSRLVAGAVGGPELAVRLSPLRVLPHANYIIWATDFCEQDARNLRRALRNKLRNSRRLQVLLYPAVACYRIVSPDDLRRVLGYMVKPIDLVNAYESAASILDYQPDVMEELNSATNIFLNNLPLVFHRLYRIARYGACHASHRDYFGHVSEWRRNQRLRNAERRRLLEQGERGAGSGGLYSGRPLSPMEKWERQVKPLVGHSLRPGRSRFYYWQQKHEPGPPPRAHRNSANAAPHTASSGQEGHEYEL